MEYNTMNLEQVAFNIILSAGNAKDYSFQALRCARNKEFDRADELIKSADSEIIKAHNIQSSMIQKEALGERQEITLLLVHAEDHLTSALLAKELIREMIELYKLIHLKQVKELNKVE